MSKENQAVFFLSTGRCGTQWLASVLADVYADRAVVAHEPIGAAYRPKQYLRSGIADRCRLPPEVVAHFEWIHQILKEKSYIETGWPWYPMAPAIFHEFGESNVKVIHLVRHPVYVAFSLATHDTYQPDHKYFSLAAIDPFDTGVVQREIGPNWKKMSQYDKCLFWWTEINLYAEELKRGLSGENYQFYQFEDLFSGESRLLIDLIEFIGLDFRNDIQFRIQNKVDAYYTKTERRDWRNIYQYPKTMELARYYGYEFTDSLETSIENRYFYSHRQWIKAVIRRSLIGRPRS